MGIAKTDTLGSIKDAAWAMVIDIKPSKQTWLMVVNTAEGGLWLTGTLE